MRIVRRLCVGKNRVAKSRGDEGEAEESHPLNVQPLTGRVGTRRGVRIRAIPVQENAS